MPTLAELRLFFTNDFPQCTATIEDAAEGRARVRQAIGQEHLRPGGTVSGPAMITLADAAAYAAILATIGIVPLAVTTNMSMTFMRRPRPDRAIVAEATLLKVGKRLAVADVRVTSEGETDVVAHATATYALPPQK
jgi:uncharacterized protein (TIGR00369 family)